MIPELEAAEDAFNAAMISNDVAQIAQCITPDWVLVTPERGPISRTAILGVIESGMLSHDMMVKHVHHVQIIGTTALVVTRGQNTGMFRGEPIAADEWITNVWVQSPEGWRCTLTHLTPAAG